MRHMSPFPIGMVPTLALVLVALTAPACSKSTTVTCSSGLVCPSDRVCSADGQACIANSCGDGVVQEAEVCDDGNVRDGDGCNRLCTSNERCGNGIIDADEVCDDGNTKNGDNCSSNCQLLASCNNGNIDVNEECDPPGDRSGYRCSWNCLIAFCGNGKVEDGEECDDGDKDDNDDCLSNCQNARCGDGHVNRTQGAETCDDGNEITESQCLYGAQSCENFCNADCSALLKLHGPYCGDNNRNGPETCDDGNNVDETRCSSHLASCTTCSADCSHELNLDGAVCGDGKKKYDEACDDGNTDACGSCNDTCTKGVVAAKARGSITVITLDDIIDGETFSISDGINVPVIFEFDTDGNTIAGHVPVDINAAEEESEVADAIVSAIDSQSTAVLDIDAWSDWLNASLIHLENNREGAFGNQRITESVAKSGFIVLGMENGRAYDCPENMGCTRAEDCGPELTCKEDPANTEIKKCQKIKP